MLFPPSLPRKILDRAFRASNGELGIAPIDAQDFLQATKEDGIEVLGWELWIIDHAWHSESNQLRAAPGHWCGGIPMLSHEMPAVVGGEGDADQTSKQLLELDIANKISPNWLASVRVNFTLNSTP